MFVCAQFLHLFGNVGNIKCNVQPITKINLLIYDFYFVNNPDDEQLSFYWFLPSPSRRSSSCVLSGWFWRWRRSPLPAGAEPCGWAAAGWRRSPAQAEGSDSFCPLLWKSQRTPGLTDSRSKPAGPHAGLRSGVTSSSLEREMSQGLAIEASPPVTIKVSRPVGTTAECYQIKKSSHQL